MTKWGDLESEEEESEEEEEEEEPEDDTESLADGIASIASGYNSSLPSGIETPEVIDLRKGKAGDMLPELLVIWKLFLFVSVGVAVLLLLAKSHIHKLSCRYASGSCNARPLPHVIV